MRRFICLAIICLLTLLSACAPNEPTWVIPGDLGTTHEWTGSLPASGKVKTAHLRIRVTGMVPPSPNSGAREIVLTLTCAGPAARQVRWHTEPVASDAPNRSNDFACGENTTLYFTHEHAEQQVGLELPIGVSGNVEYTLTAAMHMPY